MRGWITLITGALLAGLVAYAIMFNAEVVTVHLPFFSWQTEAWRALVSAALLGAGAACLLLTWPLARAKLVSRRQAKRIAQLEQELHGLRTLPIASESVTATTPQKV
jgi:uncharacterized integral membrane protein